MVGDFSKGYSLPYGGVGSRSLAPKSLISRVRFRPLTQGAVWPDPIVVLTPLLDQHLSFVQCAEDFLRPVVRCAACR